MEMCLCMKRALNAADRCRERFEDSRVRIAEAGKAIGLWMCQRCEENVDVESGA